MRTELLLIDIFGLVIGVGIGVEDGVDLEGKSHDLLNNTLTKLLFNLVKGGLEVIVGYVFGLVENVDVIFNLEWKSGNDVFKVAGNEIECVGNNCLIKLLIKFGS